MWVIPGAPLERGQGWRIWFAVEAPGDQPNGSFSAPVVELSRNSGAVSATRAWQPLQRPSPLAPLAGVLTLTLSQPEPGAEYQLVFPELQQAFHWRSLPERVGPEGVVFLLSSCFWRDDDKNGAFAAAVRFLQQKYRPCFKVLAGDQVYLDYPARFNPFVGAAEVTDQRYREYWGDAFYRDALGCCPNFLVGDDHEYWNDYPEFQPHLQRTFTAASRQSYGRIADLYYDFYQHSLNPQTPWQSPAPMARHPLGIQPPTERWFSFRIAPVSFFLADSRSGRENIAPQTHFLQEAQWQALEAWQRALVGPGVLVLGQPLFQPVGSWKDHTLLDFPEDYGRLCALIEASHRGDNDANQPHQILILSGDIHNGRHVVRWMHGDGFPDDRLREIHEFIASPASCIMPPFQGKRSPELAPAIIRGRLGTKDILWTEVDANQRTTLDNQVGYVQMTPGNNGRIRFSLWHFRIRSGLGSAGTGNLQWIDGGVDELELV